MSAPPTISVITVSWNSRETISDTLESVISQTHRPIEHIVVDGASTDGTVGILERYRDRLARLVSEPDGGIYPAMNKGLAMATGDIVGILNSDDVYADENALKDVAAVFGDPDVDVCYGNIYYVDARNLSRVIRHWVSQPFRPGMFEGGWMPPHPAFFIRRQAMNRVGLFEERYRFAADFDFMMRALEIHRLRAVYLPRVVVRMRVGGETNNSVLNVLKGNLEAYDACKRQHLEVNPLFILRKVLRKLPQYRSF